MDELLNDDQSVLYGGSGFAPELTPMYSGITDANTIMQYQRHNNVEQVAESLSWGERLEAGYTGLAHGVTSYGPEQIYRALRTIGKIFRSDDLQAFASEGIERETRLREIDPYYKVPDNWHTDGWGRSLYEGFRGISSSALSMLPGAVTMLIPGAQGVGLAMLGAGAGGAAGLAEYDSFMDEAYTKFKEINPSLTRQQIEDDNFWNAFWSGIAEGGTEFVTDVFGGRLIGLVGKAGVPAAKHVLDKLVRNLTKTTLLEAGGEVTTAMIQDYLKEDAGLDYVGRLEAFKQAIGPALVGGAAFGAGGTALSLAQGKLHNPDSNPASPGEGKAEMDVKAKELRQKYRENNFSPKALEVFNNATQAGMDEKAASSLMYAVDDAAKAWSKRTGGKAADWTGDSAQLTELISELESSVLNPVTAVDGKPEVALSRLKDYLMSELSMDQKRMLSEAYGVEATAEGNVDNVVIDTDRLEADLRQVINDNKHLENIPENVRPALEAMRDGLLDLNGLLKERGLDTFANAELAGLVGKAVEYRQANVPAKSATISIPDVDLDSVLKQHGDFKKLTGEQQEKALKDIAKATNISFDTWNMPTDQKSLFAIIDKEMRPIMDKLLGRGERTNAKQEALAKSRLEAEGINLDRFAEFTSQLTGNGNLKESATVKAREIYIASRILLAKATELGNIAHQTMAPADFIKFKAAGALYDMTISMAKAVRSESGHLLNAVKQLGKDLDLAPQRITQLYEATGGMEAAKYELTALANAKTAAEQAAVLQDSIKAKSLNMFLEFRTLNMLSSVKTHVVNTAGNSATLMNEVWNRWLAEKMGKGQGIASGETWAMIGGLWDGLKKVRDQWSIHKETHGGSTLEAVRNVSGMLEADASSPLMGDANLNKRSLTRENALDVIGGVKEKVGLSKEHGIISNGLSHMVEYMGRILGISGEILQTQDQFFKTIAANMEVAALNHREAMRQAGGDKAKYKELRSKFDADTPADHKRGALEFGKLVTFQSDLGQYAKALDNVRSKIPLVRAFVPFFKTPANIIKYAAAHTPGMASMFADIKADLNSPDLGRRHLAEARIMTGTLVWASAMGLAASGYLTGSGPVDPEEKKKLMATGWQSNSLHLGDTYIALDRLDPAAVILNTAASLVEIVDSLEGDDLDKAMSAGFGAAFRVVADRTYLKSFSDLMFAITDWTGTDGKRARQNIATSMIPASSMMRAITQQIDPVMREADGILDSLRSDIPGASEALPVRRNFLGEEVKSDGYYGPNWLSPLRQSLDKKDPVYDEIYRLASRGHKIPSMPSRTIQHKGKVMKLNGEQYSRYLEMAGVGLSYGGKTGKEKLAELVNSPRYQTWDDGQKAKHIQAIIESYRKAAREKLKREDKGIAYLLGL